MGFTNFTTNNNQNNNNNLPPLTPPLTNLANNQQTTNGIPPELINYNSKFQNAQPISFRDSVISQTYAILLGAKKPNAILTGPAGTGKTAIAEEIARQIANKLSTVPDKLLDYTIYDLPISNIVAGSGIVGDLEEKLQNIIDFASSNKVILFIDEIHMLVSNQQSTYDKITQILKPALSRGDIKVIGATTNQEIRDFLSDPAFSRRFSNVIVDELTKDQELQILEQSLPSLIRHYDNKVDIDPDLLTSIVDISDQVLRPKTHRPDSGLSLLDRAMAESIVNKKNQIQHFLANKQTQIAQKLQQDPKSHVTQRSLEKVAHLIASGSSKKPLVTKDILHQAFKPIIGQSEAVGQTIKALLLNQLNVFDEDKPLSIMLAGTSGVGKTMLSNLTASCITKTKPITLNMTEFNSSATITRILGSSAGYIGSDSHQPLPFDELETNPYQVILLDEFEKADPAVQRLFMRVLDEGKLQLANNHLIDFSKTIIFATTNASHSNTSMNGIGFNSHEKSTDNLKTYFDTELLNRFSYVIDFNTLDKDQFTEILNNTYQDSFNKLQNRLPNLPNKLSDSDITTLVNKFYDPAFGARPAKKAIEYYIEQYL